MGSADDASPTSLLVFLFTDMVGSTDLKRERGDAEGARVIASHDLAFRECVARFGGTERDNAGDGFFATFPVPSAALNCALAFQSALARQQVKARVGIHMGEAVRVPGAADVEKLLGLAVDTGGRVMSLAQGGQILLTRHAFDSARQQVLEGPAGEPVLWRAHGPYRLKGLEDAVEIHEAGIEGVAPLTPPPDSEKARRAVLPGDEDTLGWRPSTGSEVPGRPAWRLEQKLGAGGFGEVWLARSERTKEVRAFKFCFKTERLRSLKRELTLFRLLRQALGERDDIARLYDVQLDTAPYFLEMEYTPDGSLDTWSQEDDRLAKMSPSERTHFVWEIAEALAAAHSVGVLHKDIKPSNVLVRRDADGRPHPRLTDFGIGELMDTGVLEGVQITAAGFTDPSVLSDLGSRTGTRLYMAPELLAGRTPSIASDVYALGVLCYQVVVGDLQAPLGHGWERDIRDPLLTEDIAACVAGNPQDRIASCSLLAERLRSIDDRRRRRHDEEMRLAAEVRRSRLLRLSLAATGVTLVIAIAGIVVAGALNSRRREAEDARRLAEESSQRASAASAAAMAERDDKARALDDVLRLADVKRVRDLLNQADELWPVEARPAEAMATWIAEAREVLANRPLHLARLAKIRESALPRAGPENANDAAKRQWTFAEPHLAWQHQVVMDLLADLDVLDGGGSGGGMLGRVEGRRTLIATLAARSIGEDAEAWERTIVGVAASDSYGGLRLGPQLGLVPLGRDPVSNLFEFAHLGSGSIPVRSRETSQLTYAEDSAIVVVLIPGGMFRMGAQKGDPGGANYDVNALVDESPVNDVTLAPFFLAKNELTQAQWKAMTEGLDPSTYKAGLTYGERKLTGLNPVEQVSWEEADRWLARHRLELPTEAQWEYACRAGSDTPWIVGRDVAALGAVANIADLYCRDHGGPPTWPYTVQVNDGHTVHAPVGSFMANRFGLHDVHGNVMEWCRDVYSATAYDRDATTDPVVQHGSDSRVSRGGSWGLGDQVARSALRNKSDPGSRSHQIGIRAAMRIVP